MTTNIEGLSDDALNSETKRVAQVERRATAALLGLLIEVERRGLHLALGYSSLFAYCTRALLLSEQAAYSRITAARTAKRFPQVLGLLTDGALTLSSAGLLSPHLTDETADALLDAAKFKSTREVERVIASAFPQPDVPTLVRAMPRPASTGVEPTSAPLLSRADQRATGAAVRSATPSTRPVIAPISPKRYLLKVTVSEDTHEKLERARALLRHSVPDGDVDKILNRALSVLLDQVVRAKVAGARGPRKLPASSPNPTFAVRRQEPC